MGIVVLMFVMGARYVLAPLTALYAAGLLTAGVVGAIRFGSFGHYLTAVTVGILLVAVGLLALAWVLVVFFGKSLIAR